MFDFLKDRFKEPSSWAAAGGMIAGASILADFDEGRAVAEAVSQGGQAVASGGDAVAGLVAVGASLLGFFMRERGGK